MYKILISKKLGSLLCGDVIVKVAASDDAWESRSYNEQKEYLRQHPKSKKKITKSPSKSTKEYSSMSIPEIQSAIQNFQTSGSTKSFNKLYLNFLPLILNTVRKVIGQRSVSKDDVDDLKQYANIIFAKLMSTADHTNQGIVKYIDTSLYKQLIGKSREIFRSTVTIGPKDRRALRAIQKYIHKYYTEHGEMPTDYEQMAYDISNDPDSKSSHLTEDLIRDLLQSNTMSMEEEVGDDSGEKGRKREEFLGPEQLEQDYSAITTPDEDLTQSELKQTIKRSIDLITDPLEKRVLELYHGFDKEHLEAESNINEVANIIKKPRKTTRRLLQKAIAELRSMSEIQKLKNAKQILRIIKSFDKHVRFAYIPQVVKKISSRKTLVDQFEVSRFANQLVCSCGQVNCFHKDIVRKQG